MRATFPRCHAPIAALLLPAVIATLAFPLQGQPAARPPVGAAAAATSPTSTPRVTPDSGGRRKVLGLADYGRWARVTGTALSSDGAVDWLQGVELFNAARRFGKNVILLSYPGENHHLARKENAKDFQVRMKQYFDHYLKGAPAPRWMTEGVPHLQKGTPSAMP